MSAGVQVSKIDLADWGSFGVQVSKVDLGDWGSLHFADRSTAIVNKSDCDARKKAVEASRLPIYIIQSQAVLQTKIRLSAALSSQMPIDLIAEYAAGSTITLDALPPIRDMVDSDRPEGAELIPPSISSQTALVVAPERLILRAYAIMSCDSLPTYVQRPYSTVGRVTFTAYRSEMRFNVMGFWANGGDTAIDISDGTMVNRWDIVYRAKGGYLSHLCVLATVITPDSGPGAELALLRNVDTICTKVVTHHVSMNFMRSSYCEGLIAKQANGEILTKTQEADVRRYQQHLQSVAAREAYQKAQRQSYQVAYV